MEHLQVRVHREMIIVKKKLSGITNERKKFHRIRKKTKKSLFVELSAPLPSNGPVIPIIYTGAFTRRVRGIGEVLSSSPTLPTIFHVLDGYPRSWETRVRPVAWEGWQVWIVYDGLLSFIVQVSSGILRQGSPPTLRPIWTLPDSILSFRDVLFRLSL